MGAAVGFGGVAWPVPREVGLQHVKGGIVLAKIYLQGLDFTILC